MSFVLTLKSLFPGNTSNEWLMTQYRLSQEPKFLEQLYNNCANDLYHFLMSQSDPHLAEEISQRTWLLVVERRNQYQQTGRFTGWLFTIGRNLLLDELRKNKRFVDTEQAELTEMVTELDGSDRLTLEDFNRALEQLPFYQREAMMLMQENFGLKEISEITNTPQETIKSRIRYARKNLRSLMEASK